MIQFNIYTSAIPAAELLDFYASEINQRGWDQQSIVDQEGIATLGYQAGSDRAYIVITDGSLLGRNENVVMTANLSE